MLPPLKFKFKMPGGVDASSSLCIRFIPASEEATEAERLTYDEKVHGADGKHRLKLRL